MSQELEFCSTPRYCELAIESAKNVWAVRFDHAGNRTFYHNCLEVKALPKGNPLCKVLLAAVEVLAGDIYQYMNPPGTQEGSQKYWEIKGKIERMQS